MWREARDVPGTANGGGRVDETGHRLARPRLRAPDDLLRRRRRIVEIVAPAGYGKTTLLGAWRRELSDRGGRILPVPLDEAHRDPIRLLLDLYAGLTGDDDRVSFENRDVGLECVTAELQSGDRPLIVMFDDVHLLEDSEAEAVLAWLCRNQPDHVDLLFAGREQTRLPLRGRLLENQLRRLGVSDLALSREETAAFLNDIHGLDLDDAGIDILYQRTEGWPAALQLAALALAGARDRKAFIVGFGGSHRDVTDYLAEAILENLDREEVDFLLRISVLDRISAEVAQRLTGEEAPQLRLESLERRNLFLVPLDDYRARYRFHALFSDFLRARFKAREPREWRRCLMLAEDWSLARGDHAAAIEYALRVERHERAAEILAGYAETLVHKLGRHSLLMGWIERIPDHILARYPRIQIHLSWSYNFERRHAESDAVLRQLEAAAGGGDAAARQAMLAEIECARELNELSRAGLDDHADHGLALAQSWLERWDRAEDYQYGAAHVVLGYGLKTRNDHEGAMAAAARGKEHYARADSPYGLAWCDIVHILALMKMGRYRAARAAARDALDSCRRRLGPASHSRSMLSALLAAVAYELDDLAETRAALDHGMRFLATQTAIDPIICGYITLARLLATEGDPEAACEVLREGEACGARRDAPRLIGSLVGMRALILLRSGNPAAAESLFASDAMSLEGAPEEYRDMLRDKRGRLGARLALAQGDTQAALEAIRAPLHHARKSGQRRKHVELLILRHLARLQTGDEQGALETLESAVRIASSEGLKRVFIDEGPVLMRQLALLAESRRNSQSSPEGDVSLAWLESLLDTWNPSQAGPAADHDTGLLEPLTRRETQILRMIDSGLSNKELAATLFLTEGTVKWHLHNIYGKLAVRNRNGATSKARRLGLLA
ncbi:ATP-dependent transcriptional regulator [Salinisphaera sp. PC39]